MRSGKTEFTTTFQNPNTRFGAIGIIGAAIILLAMVLGLQVIEDTGAVEPFLQQWKQAVESKQPRLYQQLWDSSARTQNRNQYERALKLFSREKVEVDITGYLPGKDLGDTNRRQIERIPVTLYQDGKVLVMIYRDITVEKRGLLQRWKLIDDRIRDELEYPETTEEYIVQDEEIVARSANPTPESPPLQPLDAPVPSSNVVTPSQTAAPENSSPIVGEAPLDTQLKLSQVLGEWQQAWQGKNLKTYMSKYAEDAEITRVTINRGQEHQTRLNKKQLHEKMIALNKRYSKIKINIFQLQINGDRAVADVDFFQEFVGTRTSGSQPVYSDFGKKELVFMVDPADGLWKIYSENWRHYKNVPKYPKL
jgi:ketosteroid isomerase-like protein